MASTVTSASCVSWSRIIPVTCSGVTSGWSPERITTGPGSISGRAASTAAPVPSPSTCSATSTPSGSRPATPSPGRVTHTIRPAPAVRAASITHSTMGFPQTGWSTLGSSDRIRVPWPAAIIRTVKGSAMGL